MLAKDRTDWRGRIADHLRATNFTRPPDQTMLELVNNPSATLKQACSMYSNVLKSIRPDETHRPEGGITGSGLREYVDPNIR